MKRIIVILTFICTIVLGCNDASLKKNVDSKAFADTIKTIATTNDAAGKDTIPEVKDLVDIRKELLLIKNRTVSLFNQKKDSNSFEFQKMVFEKGLSGNYCPLISIVIVGDLFKNNTKYAILGYSESDNVLHLEIKKFCDNKWQNKIIKNICSVNINEYYWNVDTIVQFENISGDKSLDLKILKSFSIIHDLYTYEAFVFKDDTLHYVINFDKIINPICNEENGTIGSCFIVGGGIVNCSEYKIINDRAVKTRKSEYSMIDDWFNDPIR